MTELIADLRRVELLAAAHLENARAAADIFFHPNLSSFSVTDVNAAHEMFALGQAHAREVLNCSARFKHDSQ